ncbi:DUF3293 domain-containing protein [Mariniflexile sp.]|uniref:DUF3293 domain-containing protein n=1 Tax=Shewanella sp. TaxID=50422 RepID=UPI00404802A9
MRTNIIYNANTKLPDELINAYFHAVFNVFFNGKLIALQIGRKSTDLLDIYRATKSDCFAFVTAFNPNGALNSQEINRSMQSRLIQAVSVMGYSFYEGFGCDINGEWPKEDSIFIPKIDFNTACDIGNKFSQNAIVYGDSYAIPKLVILK